MRYVLRPMRPAPRASTVYARWWSDAETEGREVYEDGSWSEDQPTGLLAPDGSMICRAARGIGFGADL